MVLLQNVFKLYRLYRRPSDRLLELLPGSRPRPHTDFWVLRYIAFTVEKGETLSLVGGEVAKQKADAAQEGLKLARDKEHLLETEYAAWDLLRTTLLEAEREEGVHLGRALGDPIARRFGELTDSR